MGAVEWMMIWGPDLIVLCYYHHIWSLTELGLWISYNGWWWVATISCDHVIITSLQCQALLHFPTARQGPDLRKCDICVTRHHSPQCNAGNNSIVTIFRHFSSVSQSPLLQPGSGSLPVSSSSWWTWCLCWRSWWEFPNRTELLINNWMLEECQGSDCLAAVVWRSVWNCDNNTELHFTVIYILWNRLLTLKPLLMLS